MASGIIKHTLNNPKRNPLLGAHYIAAFWVRGTALNYPVALISNNQTDKPLFIERIRISTIADCPIEVYFTTLNTVPGVADNSAFRIVNKKYTGVDTSPQFGYAMGSLTPALYLALHYGEDSYRLQTTSANRNVGIDSQQSNIILNPVVGGSANVSIAIAGIVAATEIYVQFDMQQFNQNNIV